MPERLTWNEIKQRYPDEWVILTDHRLVDDEHQEGVVVDHGADDRELLLRHRDLMDLALLYTGEIPGGLIALMPDDVDPED